jgi:hypothetical protein
LLDGSDMTPYFWLYSWQPSTKEPVKKFVGLLAWMGLVQFPTIADVRSKRSLYKNEWLQMHWVWIDLNFCYDFCYEHEHNKLHKIQSLIDMCI